MNPHTGDFMPEKIDKIVKIQHDTKQYFIKFPKEISDFLKINDYSQCRIIIPIDPPGQITLEITQGRKREKKKRGGKLVKKRKNAKEKSK